MNKVYTSAIIGAFVEFLIVSLAFVFLLKWPSLTLIGYLVGMIAGAVIAAYRSPERKILSGLLSGLPFFIYVATVIIIRYSPIELSQILTLLLIVGSTLVGAGIGSFISSRKGH